MATNPCLCGRIRSGSSNVCQQKISPPLYLLVAFHVFARLGFKVCSIASRSPLSCFTYRRVVLSPRYPRTTYAFQWKQWREMYSKVFKTILIIDKMSSRASAGYDIEQVSALFLLHVPRSGRQDLDDCLLGCSHQQK